MIKAQYVFLSTQGTSKITTAFFFLISQESQDIPAFEISNTAQWLTTSA